jgi:hypothetical protein
MLTIGGAAGAASFTHVHNVAAAHGQPGWLAWADAIVLELMSIASGLELRRRKRTQVSTRFPAAVLGFAVTLSLAAQVVEAEPSLIGWIAAAVPALGFLVMVKVALGYTGTAPSTKPPVPLNNLRTTPRRLGSRRGSGRPPGRSPSPAADINLTGGTTAADDRTVDRPRTSCFPQHGASATTSPSTDGH